MVGITQARAIAQENRKEIKRFVKFATVGALGSVTDFTILNILIQVFGFPLAIANLFSFTAALYSIRKSVMVSSTSKAWE